jgi:hypothetical protein
MRRMTKQHRKGNLTGPQDADCTVTISKVDGVESQRTITGVSLRISDGDYQLTVAGEATSSRMEKGQERLEFAPVVRGGAAIARPLTSDPPEQPFCPLVEIWTSAPPSPQQKALVGSRVLELGPRRGVFRIYPAGGTSQGERLAMGSRCNLTANNRQTYPEPSSARTVRGAGG